MRHGVARTIPGGPGRRLLGLVALTFSPLVSAAAQPQLGSPPYGPLPAIQPLTPAAPNCIWGIDCATGDCGELGWKALGPVAWQSYAQGEYVGPARIRHVDEYRIRADDRMDFVYRLTRDRSSSGTL